jgi:hypothetical protein
MEADLDGTKNSKTQDGKEVEKTSENSKEEDFLLKVTDEEICISTKAGRRIITRSRVLLFGLFFSMLCMSPESSQELMNIVLRISS